MSSLIQSQIFHIIIMCCSGILFMIIWETASWCGHIMRTGRISKAFFEIILWIFQGFTAAAFLYYCSYGKVSIHSFCGFAAGTVLWKTYFCGTIYDALNRVKQILRG